MLQELSAQVVRFPLASVANVASVTEEEVADFYRQYGPALSIPETRAVEYVKFPLVPGEKPLEGRERVEALQKLADAATQFSEQAAASSFENAAATQGLTSQTTAEFDRDGSTTSSSNPYLNNGVAAWISYQSRETEGTQTPVETLNRGCGSCRDLAVLLIEAARCLGFGARVVTGYLYNPSADDLSKPAIGAGTTHAWADIYVPGCGWVAYDPTNGTIGGRDLIRVAVTRDISQAVPVAGSFVGTPGDYLGMTVDVSVVSERLAEAFFSLDSPLDHI